MGMIALLRTRRSLDHTDRLWPKAHLRSAVVLQSIKATW